VAEWQRKRGIREIPRCVGRQEAVKAGGRLGEMGRNVLRPYKWRGKPADVGCGEAQYIAPLQGLAW